MSATIVFSIPDPTASQDAATTAVWYDSTDGSSFSEIGSTLLSSLTQGDDGSYTWTLAGGDTTHYQMIKTRSAGGVESSSGYLLPPLSVNPSLQTIYGSAKEFGAETWAEGDVVTLTMNGNQDANGVILEPVVVTTTVGANGLFSIKGDKGICCTLQIADVTTGIAYFSKSFTISDADIANYKDY